MLLVHVLNFSLTFLFKKMVNIAKEIVSVGRKRCLCMFLISALRVLIKKMVNIAKEIVLGASVVCACS